MAVGTPAQASMGGLDGIGRSFLLGSLVGFALTFTVTGGIALVAGTGWGPALGIGAFAGFWGGPGFGGMLGAVLGSHRVDHPRPHDR